MTDETKDWNKEAFLMILRNMGPDQAAEFYAGTQAAVDGLQRNNKTFVDAYHDLLEKQAAEVAAAERRGWERGRDEAMEKVVPDGNPEVAIECIRAMQYRVAE